MYRTPYPAAYDQLPLPHKYKLPDFTKFFGQGKVSTVEHINRFIVQCGKAAQQDALKVHLFSISLSGSAFTWFTTLPDNSIIYWADLEKQFHQFFYSGVEEMKLTDLTNAVEILRSILLLDVQQESLEGNLCKLLIR